MIRRHLAEPVESALDIGTNVGGMALRAAPFARQVFGIDVAFNPVLLARRLQCGFPARLTKLRHYVDGHRHVCQPVGEPPTNTEFLVASASQLPLRGRFGLVTAMNVIDVVPEPRTFLKQVADMMADGGLLVLTSPYSWASDSVPVDKWLGGTDELPSAAAVRDAVAGLGLEILEDMDEVPWVLREHQRWHRVFLNHCLIARKGGTS
jgi:SAM-dependent methyltransferase